MKNIKVSIGSDHKGYLLKKVIIAYLESQQIKVNDYGTTSEIESVDYPDFASKVCLDVQKKQSDFGILICYTGIGMSMVANKYRGVRAALVWNVENTKLTRNHNNANVLCLGAKDVSEDTVLKIVETFLRETYLGERHEKRLQKIAKIEDSQER